jgi:uncharacterized membrane protein YphA (DoxX/SURF4 family)
MEELIQNTGLESGLDSHLDITHQTVRWNLPLRIAFRFCFCYLAPFSVAGLFVFAYFMYFMTNAAFWNLDRFDPWRAVLPWICSHIFRVHRKLFIFPDADFLSGYLQHLFEIILALVATVVWSIVDRKRTNYRRLYAWFALFLRFSLALVLFSYGFDKVFPIQFRPVTASRLSQQVGNLDMFNMLWIFMASSKPYTIFSGIMEVLAGLLLLTPRLETLGALLAVPVLTNVFLLNMDYGVPVKIISSHLLLMALFLAAPAMLRILRLFVLRQPVQPVEPRELSPRSRVDRTARIAVFVLGVALGVIGCMSGHQKYRSLQADLAAAEKSPAYGFWIADSFSVPTAGSPALFTAKLQQEYKVGPGTDHWVSLALESPGRMIIELPNNFQDGVNLALDAHAGIADVSDDADSAWKAKLTFQPYGEKRLRVEGTVNGVPISSTWHRKDLSDFQLTQDQFVWIPPD